MSYTIVEGMTGSELFPGSNAWSCMASLAELSDPPVVIPHVPT